MKTTSVCLAIAVAAALPSQIRADLIAHYTFDSSGDGPLADSSTPQTGGTLDLDPVDGIETTVPLFGDGSFRSSQSGRDFGADAGTFSTGDFTWNTDQRTVAFWMQASNPAGESNITMIGLGNYNQSGPDGGVQNGARFDIRITGGGLLRTEVAGGGVVADNTTPVLTDGKWHHIAVVVPSDGAVLGDVIFYIDGVLAPHGASSTALITGVGPVHLADSFWNGDRDFYGLLDDVRIYDEALDATAIGELFGDPPIVQFVAPDTGTLFYQVAPDVTAVTIDDGSGPVDIATLDPDGDCFVEITPTASTTTYTLSVTRDSVETTSDVVVEIPLIASFDTDLDLILAGESIELSWATVADLSSLTLDDGSGPVTVTPGAQTLGRMPTTTTTYTLAATAANGIDTLEAMVTVDVGTLPAPGTYGQAILDDMPLAYYQFEEAPGSGFVLDSSGNGFHSVAFTGSPVTGSTGAIGSALEFTGADAVELGLNLDVSTTGTLDPMSGGITIEAVVRQSLLDGAQVFVAQQNGGGNGRTFINLNEAQELTSFFGGTGTPSTALIPLDTWCHVMFVFDDVTGAIRYYVDGSAAGGGVVTAESAAGSWILGANKNLGGQFLQGKIDELAVYDYMLDDPDNDGVSDPAIAAARYADFKASATPLLGFSASVLTIDEGDSLDLAFKVSDLAETITISGIGTVTTSPVTVMPTTTTTYTIAVTGGGQSYDQEITVTVIPAIVDFSLEAIGPDGSGGFEIKAITPTLGKTYQLLRGTDLLSFPTPVGAPFEPTETETSLTDPAPPAGSAFYILSDEVGP